MGDGFGAGRGIRVSLRNRVRIRLVLSVLNAFEGLTSLGMSLEGHQLGEFEVLERLGQGGMGAVYKARQSVLKRLVAIKTLSPALAMDGEFVTRFHNEAVAAAALNHPNLVQVYAAGENAGQHWFAMEFVDGESVQKRLDRLGKLEPEEAIAICMHVATALDFGWRKAQLIHRDIKPDNIFLSNDGEVKLGDLGLAKSASQENSLTMTGASMGTPLYISPEQTEGRRDIDLRSDIYSLGCTLFHLICGSPPYSGESAVGVMIKHVSAPLPDICAAYSHVHPAIAAVVLKMMQKAPSDRYQSYSELTTDLLAAFAALSAPVVQPVTATAQAVFVAQQEPAQTQRQAVKLTNADIDRTPKRKTGLWIAAALGLAVVGGGAFWLVTRSTVTKSQTAEAKPVSKEAWRPLFDGNSLKGWRGDQQGSTPKGWMIQNGAIHVSGKNPLLVFDEEFESFELELEWKVAPNANSGIFYWTQNGPLGSSYSYPEFQLHDPAQSDKYKSGALWGMITTQKVYDNPVGQWNKARIVALGGKVEHWVNGELACQYNLDDPSWQKVKAALPPNKKVEWESVRKGAIALQANGGDVDFKNIRVRTLAPGK